MLGSLGKFKSVDSFLQAVALKENWQLHQIIYIYIVGEQLVTTRVFVFPPKLAWSSLVNLDSL